LIGGFVQSYRPIPILLVEDNADDIEITRGAFRKSLVANELSVVRDGEEALEYLFHEGRYAEPGEARLPDLVLLDLNLPRINGIEVLQRIRAADHLAALPVIMLTSSQREEDIIASYRFGSNTYISKPVQFADFLKALEILGEYWIVLAKLPKAA
jgi:two-component system response regulator